MCITLLCKAKEAAWFAMDIEEQGDGNVNVFRSRIGDYCTEHHLNLLSTSVVIHFTKTTNVIRDNVSTLK